MVGMQVCRSCHADIYNTYIETGMGRSFATALHSHSQAIFDAHSLVYDSTNNLYYQPFVQGDSMYIKEFRLRGKDTIHRRVEKIDFIIGSGHHTNSHLLWRNGYLTQAPITFYTQDRRWDLAPGFERVNQRFARLIASECLTCHNHYPKPVPGSENRYEAIPTGIECERCHGAGGLHVREKLAGKLVDTATGVDYTIVNPRHLPIERQMDLCQRCHLQGIAVLKEGKTFYDFRPGMALKEVMDVYLPRFTDSHERFIMASQADRLRLSPCYQTGQLSCITCHNPHQNVHASDKNRYNSSCKQCHNGQSTQSRLHDCSATATERAAEGDNCVRCHLPRSGSIDIPHITISDHNISKATARRSFEPEGRPIAEPEKQAVARFLGLENLTNPTASPLDHAKGYLALYDKFIQENYVLDSAWMYVQRSTDSERDKMSVLIHYYFAKGNYAAVVAAAKFPDPGEVKGAWTAYRVGEAHYQLQQWGKAEAFLAAAVRLMPEHLDFKEKWGLAQARAGYLEQAKATFEAVIAAHSQRPLALMNLGFIYAQQGNAPRALQLYDQALALDPDYESALLNKGALLLQKGKMPEARAALLRILERNPRHQQALELLKRLR